MTDRNELEKLLAAATEGPWEIAAYYTGTGPDERCHGMIVSDGDWPTGVIDENESPTSDSLSHDLALICFLRNNAHHYLSLMQEVERLREALKPFAAYVQTTRLAFPNDPVSAGDVCSGSVSYRDFEQAYEALGETK